MALSQIGTGAGAAVPGSARPCEPAATAAPPSPAPLSPAPLSAALLRTGLPAPAR